MEELRGGAGTGSYEDLGLDHSRVVRAEERSRSDERKVAEVVSYVRRRYGRGA